jgi:RNA-directed DNA polymerase
VRHRKHPQDSAQSETPACMETPQRENRETPSALAMAGRLEKAMSREPNMHADGESDGRVLPSRCPNMAGNSAADGTDGSQPTKENIR